MIGAAPWWWFSLKEATVSVAADEHVPERERETYKPFGGGQPMDPLSGGWAGRYIKCCPKLWPALDVRGVSVLCLLREGAEFFVCPLESAW